MKEEDRRPDSEQLLRSIQNADGPPWGRLKIFFGYAAGVGKTYAMLEAAHRAKEAGVDVVAGYIEPHTRPETMALLEGLEVLPTKTVTYKGISLAVPKSPPLVCFPFPSYDGEGDLNRGFLFLLPIIPPKRYG